MTLFEALMATGKAQSADGSRTVERRLWSNAHATGEYYHVYRHSRVVLGKYSTLLEVLRALPEVPTTAWHPVK